MGTIKFRMAARCEAAGRSENEDNYQPCDDLTQGNWGFTADKEITLGKNGALIVVCDGMGGMNAGEVASELAVNTIKKYFSDNNLNAVVSSTLSIKKFIEKAIVFADAAIKDESRADANKKGMGSTIVLAWFVGNMVYVGWCGDSRAYRYNPIDGFQQLSHDHSYVQELVDAGKLSEELAFDHPNNNIITRSLGDPNRAAKPEVREFPLRNGDIIMLCTDGLNGVLRDNEMKNIIENNCDTMTECRDALWEAAREAGWNDNVTVGLCQILSGAKKVEPNSQSIKSTGFHNISKKLIIILATIIIVLIGIIAYLAKPEWFKIKGKPNQETTITAKIDSILSKYENENALILFENWGRDSARIMEFFNQIQKDTLEFTVRFEKVKKAVCVKTEKQEPIKEEPEKVEPQKVKPKNEVGLKIIEITKDTVNNLVIVKFSVTSTKLCVIDMVEIINAEIKEKYDVSCTSEIYVQNKALLESKKFDDGSRCNVVKKEGTVLTVRINTPIPKSSAKSSSGDGAQGTQVKPKLILDETKQDETKQGDPKKDETKE